MIIKHPESDVRPWLVKYGTSVKPYTRKRIEESFEFVEEIISRCDGLQQNSAYDVGCGPGFNSFAIGAYFNQTVAIDSDLRAIWEARRIGKNTGVPNILFRFGNAEHYRASTKVDLIFCNLMSHSVRSRCRFLQVLADNLSSGGYLFYSEITEGYAPREIDRAIKDRDGSGLNLRLCQVLNGFLGGGGFRFFVPGTLRRLLQSYGLQLIETKTSNWNGLIYSEQALCRATSIPMTDNSCLDPDYLEPDADFMAIRKLYHQMLSERARAGFSKSRQDHLYDLAISLDNRFAPYLLFFPMADQVLPAFWPKVFLWGKFKRLSQFFLNQMDHLCHLSPTKWEILEDLNTCFLNSIRKRPNLHGG